MVEITERRKTPRIDLTVDETIRVQLRHRVQLADISLTGALMACAVKLPVGTRGYLRAGLTAGTFTAEVETRRHHPRADEHEQVSLGAIFSSMDEESRRNLERFLRQASE
jgi:c-di-GMP-binding flagellar brake protein YcgR